MNKITKDINNNEGIATDTYLNDNHANRLVKFAKASVLAFLIFTGVAQADQVIFSQYDGVNTWNNVYVEIDNARAFAKLYADEGVGFVEAQGMSESGGQAEVSSMVVNSITRELHFSGWHYTSCSCFIRLATVKETYYKSSPSSTYLDRYSRQKINNIGHVFGNESGVANEGDSDTPWQNREILSESIDEEKVVTQEEVASSWEQPLPARAIVAVETYEDLQAIVKAMTGGK